MKAMRVNNRQSSLALVPAALPQPKPGDSELLIRVHAAGVTPTELLWYPTTHTKEGGARTSAVPGHEFSGVVAALGKGANSFKVGDEIYGMNDWFADGATAEFCLTQPQHVALKPKGLTHELAATVPIGALTAWQGLLDRAKLQTGERVLIHGAAGAVGLFAVQLAHLHSAYVIATASGRNSEFLKKLGADGVIDYKTSRFEDEVEKVDIVFDAVGGETLDRSWNVLKPGGRMVTIAADSEGTADQRVKDAFFIVEPNQKQLLEVAKLLDAGTLKAFVNAVVPLDEATVAYSRAVRAERGFGKVVIAVPHNSRGVGDDGDVFSRGSGDEV
jgi:NADPH:quinone reductase-like Zn-dependent oxidoreductase